MRTQPRLQGPQGRAGTGGTRVRIVVDECVARGYRLVEVPESAVAQVLQELAERGFDEVEEVVTAEERLNFELPAGLRPSRP